MKIGIIVLLFHCKYFDERFIKCLLSGTLPSIYFLSKPLNLIGCHGNQKALFAKTKYILKNQLQGDEAGTL